ncbi:MAG: flagellin domain protein [Thermoleophilia bacterium]|nr:flagellin domain protein [Thermoleophilia bacterium]
MGLSINSNIEAFNAHRSMTLNSLRLSRSMEKLSSGLRINRAADDAAGLGISERLRGQIRGIEQASRNTQDGISLVQTAEGALQEVSSILQRVRELAVQYQNGVYGAESRAAITAEVAQLSAEVGRMIGSSQFNGVTLLNASASVTLQVGPNAGATNQLAISLANVGTAIGTALADFASLGATGNPSLTAIDAAIDSISTARATYGAIQNRLEYTSNSLATYQENLMASESRIRDVDMAQEITNLTRLQILQQSSTAMLSQANSLKTSILSLLE